MPSVYPADARAASEVDFAAGRAGMPAPEFYTRQLIIYLRTAGETWDQLPGWMDADPERVVIEAHGLKSASASVGAMAFSEAARSLEIMGKQKNFATLRAGLPACIAQGRRVLCEMQNFPDQEETRSTEKQSDDSATPLSSQP